jgi:hypothetical protein
MKIDNTFFCKKHFAQKRNENCQWQRKTQWWVTFTFSRLRHCHVTEPSHLKRVQQIKWCMRRRLWETWRAKWLRGTETKSAVYVWEEFYKTGCRRRWRGT